MKKPIVIFLETTFSTTPITPPQLLRIPRSHTRAGSETNIDGDGRKYPRSTRPEKYSVPSKNQQIRYVSVFK